MAFDGVPPSFSCWAGDFGDDQKTIRPEWLFQQAHHGETN
jgi:hypothetical protein